MSAEMNKHIELVKKWLDNPESVTQQELEDNSDSAACAVYADATAAAGCAAAGCAAAGCAAYYADVAAAYADADTAYTTYAAHAARRAAFWIEQYEELTNE